MADSFGKNEREEAGGERTEGTEWQKNGVVAGSELGFWVGGAVLGQTPAMRVRNTHTRLSWPWSSVRRLNRRAAKRDGLR
jgi:hypothetical protein